MLTRSSIYIDDLVNKVFSNNNAMSTDKDTDASFKQLQASIQSLCQQFSHFQEEVTARIDQLNWVCVKLGESTTKSKAPYTYSTDRSLKTLLFGIQEDKNTNVWQQRAFDVLKFVAGKDVDTVDMFRLGRFVKNKVCPVIVKLRTFWDKRILLSSSYKLKSCVFLVADEPIDVIDVIKYFMIS